MRWMKRLQSILQNKTKRVVVFCCLFFPTLLYAQGLWWDDPTLKEAALVDVLQQIISVASWIWVIPATFAWKFMTNYFIYGDSFYLANYLFKFWQIIRTFAYFALWFYFMWSILYMRFNDAEAKSWIADLIKNTIIGWFLIWWSRWLIASAVDLSIIFTSAVASIPSQIYEQKRTISKQQCFYTPIKIDVKEDLTVDPVLLSKKENRRPITWQEIAPDGSNIAWPLTFFGSSVLWFFDMVFLSEWAQDGNAPRINSAAFIIIAVKAIMAIMLIVPMFILVIVNIIRIVYLWLRIVFSPFIVLMNIFEFKISDWLQKYIDRKNILWLILQPVAVVGMLSVWLILIIELTSIFNLCVSKKNGADPFQWWSVAVERKQNNVVPVWDELFEVTLKTSLWQLWDTLWWVTGELILAWFVIILLWWLIKVWFSFSELTAWLAKDITDSTEEMAWTIPVIKLPWWGWVWVWAINQLARQNFGLEERISNKKSEQQQDVLDRAWLGQWMVKKQEIAKLKQLAQQWTTTLVDLQKQITEKLQKGKINSTDAQDIVKTWLSNNSNKLSSDDQTTLRKIGIDVWALSKLTADEINKIRSDDKKNADVRKLLNRLFTSWKVTNEQKIDTYWWDDVSD